MKGSTKLLPSGLLPAKVLGAPLAIGYGVNPVSGVATSCGGLASCSFSLSDGNMGMASTSAFVGGYVGQSPLNFAGGSVTFRLAGEAQTTYASDVYSGQAVPDGSSSTAGTPYHTTGTFSAVDINTGEVVTGTTDTIVGIKGQSGRGGGNTYTLVNGSITITPTDQDGTSTSIKCAPTSFVSTGRSYTKCVVTVTYLNSTSSSHPMGTVKFSSTGPCGRFWSPSTHGASRKIVAGTCAVHFVPYAGVEGTIRIYAAYDGDGLHFGSSGSTELYLTAPL